MSRYRVVLFALVVSLVVPAAVRADALDFGFVKGLVAFSSTTGTGLLTNNPKAPKIGKTKAVLSTLNFVGAIPGGKSFSGKALGTVQYTTGFALSGATSSLIKYGAGGSIIIKATKTFGTGVNKILAGTLLFTGFFSGTQNFAITQIGGGPKPGHKGVLTGNVSTTFASPKLLALLGLSPVAGGIFKSLEIDVSISQNGGAVTSGFMVVSPEPATLALAGTGLLSLAGLLRRKKKS